MTRRSLALLWVSVVVAGVCSDAVAQSEPAQSRPTKPVRAVLPFAPGTGADIITRIVLNQLSQQLGQSFVIENKGGAGGSLVYSMSALGHQQTSAHRLKGRPMEVSVPITVPVTAKAYLGCRTKI